MSVSCDCDGVCGVGCLCILSNGAVCDDRGCLESFDRAVLYECNSQCTCSRACPNRTVQNGSNAPLQVYRAGEKGLALRTLSHLPAGKFICEYFGQVVRKKEALIREGLQNTNWIFVLREHISARNEVLCTYIDASQSFTLAKYMNHSCDANCAVFPVRVETIVPRLAIFALRDIDSEEELTLDYSGGGGGEIQSATYHQSQITCLCKSDKCKGYLPHDPKLF